MKFLQVMISSELRTQGLLMLEHLIRKRLIFGGPVFSGPARFLWKNEIVEHDYCWTITFTPQDLRDELIKEAEKESAEAICMITFSPFDGSPAMQALLEEAFRGRDTETKPVPLQGCGRCADVHPHERHSEAHAQLMGRPGLRSAQGSNPMISNLRTATAARPQLTRSARTPMLSATMS